MTNGHVRSIIGAGAAILVSSLAIAAPPPPGDADAGGKVYNQTCVACHGENGEGAIPGTPDLTLKDGVLAQSESILLQHLLNGFQSPGSPMAMPAKGGDDELTIKDLRDVLTYMHRKFHYNVYRQ